MKLLLSAFVFIVCFLYLTGDACAAGLEYYGIEDTINEDMSIRNVITLKFDKPISHLDYQLNFRIHDLRFEANFDYADCRVTSTDEKSKISCDFIGMTPEKNTLVLHFVSKSGIQKADGGYRFTANYGISLPIKRVFAQIELPKNSILGREVANESYAPADGKILTDGRHIMVYWERFNLSTGNELQFSVLYTTPLLGGVYSLVVAFLALVAVVVMVGAAVYIRGHRTVKSSEVVESVLNKDEKVILNILNRHGGKTGQKVLVRESDFSKAKVSRLVRNLKERGVVDIEPISGRENRIILKIARG